MDFEPTSLSCYLLRGTCCPSIRPGKRAVNEIVYAESVCSRGNRGLARRMGNGARLFRELARSHQPDCPTVGGPYRPEALGSGGRPKTAPQGVRASNALRVIAQEARNSATSQLAARTKWLSHRFQSAGTSPVSTTYRATSRNFTLRCWEALRSTWNA
jgi:hypothetical protein